MTKITRDPKILGGKPIIEGTRISVDFVLELLASGMTTDDILREYPSLSKEAIFAAIDFAAQVIKKEELIYV